MRQRNFSILAGLGALVLATAAYAAQGAMSVQVRHAQVRVTPSFLGKVVATLDYGARIDVLEEKDPWRRVQEGWLHQSALSTKEIVLKPGARDVKRAASSDEVALAGKGFNEQVEREYRQRSHLDYAWVDRMERYTVSPEQMAAFLSQGGVAPGEGGR